MRSSGSGRLVLIGGEAGVGKTSLVDAFCERHASVPVLAGACEALFTPRPLGPLLDIAVQTGGELVALTEGDPSPAALLGALARAVRRPSIIVLEDLHWADEATLDVLRLLGRRVTGMATLVLATYRDDELERRHPLRIVLGELATSAVTRVSVSSLSAEAVGELAAPRGIDPVRLYEHTRGRQAERELALPPGCASRHAESHGRGRGWLPRRLLHPWNRSSEHLGAPFHATRQLARRRCDSRSSHGTQADHPGNVSSASRLDPGVHRTGGGPSIARSSTVLERARSLPFPR